jgi:hypothetical protein
VELWSAARRERRGAIRRAFGTIYPDRPALSGGRGGWGPLGNQPPSGLAAEVKALAASINQSHCKRRSFGTTRGAKSFGGFSEAVSSWEVDPPKTGAYVRVHPVGG